MPYVMPAVLLIPEVNELGADTTLPGLRGLARLADCRPKIVIDAREQEPLVFTRLQSVTGTLYSGDYSIRGLEEGFAQNASLSTT